MATRRTPLVPLGDVASDAAAQQPPWRNRVRLSSMGDAADAFLARAGFDRGPWLVVAFAAGIAAWFALGGPGEWLAAIAAALLLPLGALALWRGKEERTHLVTACAAVGLLVASGLCIAWTRSALVGAEAIERMTSAQLTGRVLDRIEQPAQGRIRLVLAAREPETGRAIKVRVNVPLEQDRAGLAEGAVVRLRAMLMPPAGPMLPGGYDFARAAWFQGFAATGNAQGAIELVEPVASGAPLANLQRSLSDHVRKQLDGSAGAIAAAFASGDRGGITEADDEAMRDSGLTHLLSISGLHVSAVIAAAYFLATRLLALWPWLALRVRLPVYAAGVGALTGIFYTLLTGAEVPTVRSCIGAVLVLIALALGREPLSLRMVATGAFFVLLLWPESLIGPSFQLSFSAVIAIVALHNCGPVRVFLAPREESWIVRLARSTTMLLVTGFVIEFALMPIVLFHFHRAGFYGALANVIAIPLVTFASMPLIALGLFLDLLGMGAPAWWAAGKSLDLMLWIAHFTASQPGAVKMMPQMSGLTFALFIGGGSWLALWRGRARLLGLVPAALATMMLLTTPVPDLLITGDGRHVGIAGEGDRLLMLRDTRSSFVRENVSELAGFQGEPLALAEWPGARCSADFCSLTLRRDGREWHLLMSRSDNLVELEALAKACEASDIVISDRRLPRSCRPRWLKADRRMLERSGGLAVVLSDPPDITSVVEGQGEHGWWRGPADD